MKHIESINEWFGRKNDKPTNEVETIFKNLIERIKNENIPIRFKEDIFYPQYGDYYLFVDDDNKYVFSIITSSKKCFLNIYNRNKFIKSFIIWDEKSNFEIPRKYYNIIAKIYEEQLKSERINREINTFKKSEVGQDAEKYNL